MSLLLDTHALLWLCEGNRRLGVRALAAIREGAYVSAIVTWEIAIKAEQGKLRVDGLESFLTAADFAELAFTSAHARDAGALPRHHGNPFDRALVAQARSEGLVLVTADPAMQAYDVALLDATR